MPQRPFWLLLGLASTGCGLAGVLLPLVPTTPFLLLASYSFARSSPRLNRWLLQHPRFGPLIENWRKHGGIAPPVKATAVTVMAGALALSWLLGFPSWILALQAAILSVVAAFILTRPSGRPA